MYIVCVVFGMCLCVCMHVHLSKNNVTVGGWAVAHTNLEDPLSMFTYHFNCPTITTKGKAVGKTGSYLKTWSEERK